MIVCSNDNRVGRSLKNCLDNLLFKSVCFVHVYVEWELEGQKKALGQGFFFVKTCSGRVTGNK